MEEKPKLKTSAIIADLTGYLVETEKFEKAHKVIEKHVSSQIIQMPAPQTGIPGFKAGAPITTVMISVLYVHEVAPTPIIKN